MPGRRRLQTINFFPVLAGTLASRIRDGLRMPAPFRFHIETSESSLRENRPHPAPATEAADPNERAAAPSQNAISPSTTRRPHEPCTHVLFRHLAEIRRYAAPSMAESDRGGPTPQRRLRTRRREI